MRNLAGAIAALILLIALRPPGLSAQQQLAFDGGLTLATEADCGSLDGCPLVTQLGPNPGTALMSGLVLPGMGYFYTDQPTLGALVLGAAGASAGLGLLYKKVEVACLGLQVNGVCAPGEPLSRVETRPLLGPGLAVAGAVTILGAINAYRNAKKSRFQSLAREAARLNALVPRLGYQSETTALRVEPMVRGWTGGVRAEFNLRF